MNTGSAEPTRVFGLDDATRTAFSTGEWILDAVQSLSYGGPILVRLGAHISGGDAIARATSAVHGLASAMSGTLPTLAVDVGDIEMATLVLPGHSTRFLLPHTDGAHRSFVTPSTNDVPEWSPDMRTFDRVGGDLTPFHTVFQGFLVLETGSLQPATCYYDIVRAAADAYEHRTGASANTVTELQRWVGQNIALSLASSHVHQSRYLTLPALLGATLPHFHLRPPQARRESEFTSEQLQRFEVLRAISFACSCGACEGPGERQLCDGLVEAMGLTWPQFRERYEFRLSAERHDLVIASNLFLWHAAESSYSDRALLPLSLVALPRGPAYEAWLSRQWRVHAGRVGVLT